MRMKRKFMRILLSFLALAGAVSVSGCDNGPTEPTIGDANWVDYAHNGSIQLTLDYKGKDFYKDGIGEVTLKTHIDGDTAHFFPVVKTTKSDPIKARYYGIDTPESTGRIQEYGQEASDFNHEKLENAKKTEQLLLLALKLYMAHQHLTQQVKDMFPLFGLAKQRKIVLMTN